MSIYQSDKKTGLVWRWEYYPIPAHLIWSYCQSNADCTFYQGNFHWSLLQLRCADCHHHIDRVTRGINTLDLCYKAELLPEWWLSGWHCHLRAKMSSVRFPAGGWLLLWCTAWPTSTSKCAKHSDYQLGTTLELKVIQTCIKAQLPRQVGGWEPQSCGSITIESQRVRIKELYLAGA